MSDSVRQRSDVESPAAATAAPKGAALTPIHELRPGRQRMLDVARVLFCTRGFERTPLRSISDSLGVTKAAVYYHFKAKDELLVAIVGPLLDRVDEVVGAAGPSLASTATRRAFLGRYVEALSHAPDVTGLLVRDPAVREHAVGQRFADQHARMRALLGGPGDVATDLRAATALRALELAVVEFGDADQVQVRETALNIALAVLAVPTRPRTPR